MFTEEFAAMGMASKAKVSLLEKNFTGYFLASMLAGVYVGFGILLIFTVGGALGGAAWAKVAMGISFGIALSLVVSAGAELFTGNNLVMSAGFALGKITGWQVAKLSLVCLIGNWVGGVVLSLVFWGGGLATAATGELMAETSAAKMAVPFAPLFFRGMLCNTLVCIAIWCTFRLKSEGAKLAVVFWCLYCFITCGFEHSIANMTLLTVGMLSPGEAMVSWGGYFYNILVVTLGNVAGAVLFVALPYGIIAKNKEA